jgi:TonB-linked SusC/RagA family outer membrane protein
MKSHPVRQWLFTVAAVGTLLWPVSLAAQATGQIAGAVTSETGQPLAGASISIPGTAIGTLTGANGRFTVSGVPAGQQSVRVTLIGYTEETQAVQVVAGQVATTNFQLASQALELEGVVAVGYGTQRRVNLTGAVASVNIEEAASVPVPSVAAALQGLSPGLQIIDGGEQPGRNAIDLLVRGQGSLGRGGNQGSADASRPLVLIDGVEGDMNTLDINDVENISILKDASSAAIYGSRAANGVILITTKRGLAGGRPQISYSGYVGMQNATAWPETVGAVRHMELRNIARSNLANWCATTAECDPAAYPPDYTQEQIDATRRGEGVDEDWFDTQFDPAPMQDHNLRITGGSDAARYALSLDYMREDGMMPTTGADRVGLRLNTDFRATDRISGGLDVSGTRRSDVVPANNFGALFFLIHDTPPTRPVFAEDGMYGLNLFGFNAIAYARESGDEARKFTQGLATGRLNFDVLPEWAEIQTLASVRYDTDDWERFATDSRYIETWPADGAPWGPNRLEQRNIQGLQTTLRALLNFGHSFQEGTHDWSGVLGYEQISQTNDEFRAWRQDFFNNDLRQIDLGNADTRGNRGFGSEWALRSVFGRMNYTLLGRYLFEANARYDGSSRFAEGNRFGIFPSFSAGWRISEEPFFNIGLFDELKLRASWGRLGNQDVPLYSYYSTISLSQPYWLGGSVQDGAAVTSLANEDLSWETTTVTDVGLDAAFLQGRLSLSGDIYNRRTEDILLRVPIPDLVGRSAPFVNAGVVENNGWELALGWRDAIGQVDYGVNFNLSDNRNEVIDLNDTGPYVSNESVVVEGSPIRSWYGLEADGYFRDQAEIDAHAQPSGWITRPGDLRFKDQNGDGAINEDDRVIIGDPNPRYMYGVNLNAGWRGFDASALLQGVGKRDQYLALGFIQGPVWENYTSEWHNSYYDPEQDNQDARHPTWYANYNRNYYTTSSHWILDGSFMKLRNAQLGYTMPSSVTDRIGTQRMRVYVTGKNLWMNQNLGIDLDPEYARVRADYYPQTRVFSIGTDISF